VRLVGKLPGRRRLQQPARLLRGNRAIRVCATRQHAHDQRQTAMKQVPSFTRVSTPTPRPAVRPTPTASVWYWCLASVMPRC
jgi:hypothetical protein